MKDLESEYLKIISELGIYSNKKNLILHLDNLFSEIDFLEKKVLDVGGGSGLHSFFAAIKGAALVDCLEPEFDGSHSGMKRNFNNLKMHLDAENVNLHSVTFQDFVCNEQQYDFILTHNVINHLDEVACKNLRTDQAAKDSFISIFKKFHTILKPAGKILVADCGNRNLFGDLGIYNPFANDIDWEIHQEPEFWISLIKQAGFKELSMNWSTFNSLGKIGRLIFGNRFFSYITFSHFYFWIEKY